MSLSQAQYQAISHLQGPCMVLAGPGSGKTLTIVKRIEYLIKKYKVNPEDILVMTFTKAAASEMRERFYYLMKNRSTPVTFGTFHSVFYGILKWAYQLSANHFLNDSEQYKIIVQLCEKMQIEVDQDEVREILKGIGKLKSHYPIPEPTQTIAGDINLEDFCEIYRGYEKQKDKMKKFDFDDMLVKCCELFQERPDILKKWQERFPYILIDEFQDINPIQYKVIRMLSEKSRNLFVVGDDDQSIYRFRGAEPSIMLGFKKDYPDTTEIVLDINFRSTQEIVNKTLGLIEHNKQRFRKKVKAHQGGEKSIHIEEMKDITAESDFIVKKIQEMLKNNIEPSQIAVLFRTKSEAGYLAEALLENNVKFCMKEQISSIYEHFIGQDITSYIMLALGSVERKHYLRVCNRPNRYIKRECFDEREVNFEDIRIYYEEDEWIWETLDQFEVDIKLMKGMTPYTAIAYIRKKIGYDCFLREHAKWKGIDEEGLFQILDEIEERAKKYKTLAEWLKGIEAYNLHLQKEKSNKQKERTNGVQLLSMHGAKGLEYKIVFVISANEGVIPHKKAKLEEEIEEERRIFYVAATRAKEKLYISYLKEKNGKEQCPSRFIEQLN